MKRWMGHISVCGAVAVLLAGAVGCVAPRTTVPDRGGAHADTAAGVRVETMPNRSQARRGEALEFTTRITNTGDRALHLPRKPDVLFAWVYPSGRRDNLLVDLPHSRSYTWEDVIRLAPGEWVEVRTVIDTSYFPLPGPVRFAAILQVPRNTNAELQPFFSGRARSTPHSVTFVN